MRKRIFYTELAYVAGLLGVAVGTALTASADFGVSMVVAPAYLVYLKLSEYLPFFTFGMAEYGLQALLLVLMMAIVRRFKFSYLFSFVTAVLYGLILDGTMTLAGYIPMDILPIRVICYVAGIVCTSAGVAFFFQTYISPEVYELFVKEVSGHFNRDINKFKTCYDCVSCAVGIALSFAFFGLWHFEGVKLGTVVCALVNGFLIGNFTKLYKRIWSFEDGLKLRKYFE